MIGSSTPEQLAAFREKAETLELTGIAPRKMIGIFSDAIAPASQREK
jgi:hypothetical protein